MKILVISDSHGRPDRIAEAVNLHKNTLDCIIHLGDGLYDTKLCSAYLEGVPLITVSGNHEDATRVFVSGEGAPSELMLNLEGYKLLLMHGHRFGVKAGYERAAAYAHSRGASLLLFGHTHIPFEKFIPEGTMLGDIVTERPMYLFNPGSIASRSCGLIELRHNGVLMSHMTLQ